MLFEVFGGRVVKKRQNDVVGGRGLYNKQLNPQLGQHYLESLRQMASQVL